MSSVKNQAKKDKQTQNRMKVAPYDHILACPKCHHLHYPVTRKEAERQVKVFNNYFNGLTLEEKHKFYKNTPSSVSLYEYCFMCQEVNYKEFIIPTQTNSGTYTMQPIIDPKE